jgi:hypothetical protein
MFIKDPVVYLKYVGITGVIKWVLVPLMEQYVSIYDVNSRDKVILLIYFNFKGMCARFAQILVKFFMDINNKKNVLKRMLTIV